MNIQNITLLTSFRFFSGSLNNRIDLKPLSLKSKAYFNYFQSLLQKHNPWFRHKEELGICQTLGPFSPCFSLSSS